MIEEGLKDSKIVVFLKKRNQRRNFCDRHSGKAGSARGNLAMSTRIV